MSDISTQMRELDEDNVLPFKRLNPLLGGNGPGVNWLKDLKEGTIFITRLKRHYSAGLVIEATEYLVYNNKPDSYTWLMEAGGTSKWVHSESFSLKFEEPEILRTITLPETTSGTDNRELEDHGGGSSSNVVNLDRSETSDPNDKGKE